MNKALFLDRDGIINIDNGYVYEPAKIIFNEGIFELCEKFQMKKYMIFIVTNQSGIGRGFFTEKQLKDTNKWLCKQFSDRGILIKEICYCPYHPIEGIGKYKKESYLRKPNPGMFIKIKNKYNLNMYECISIGDKCSDIEAAKKAGVGFNIIVGMDCFEASMSINSIKLAVENKIWEEIGEKES